METRDRDIRHVLNDSLVRKYAQDPGTLIIHELKVCQGEARVDLALINGEMHAYEIKSDRDTLERLPGQASVYSRVFDTVTVVTSETHLKSIVALIPEWWGISLAIWRNSELAFENVRLPEENTAFDPFSLAQFLWRDELLGLLARHGLDRGVKRFPRFKLWSYVADNIPIDELRDYVRTCLKKRENWRPDALRT